jgi:hypothetical protein
MSSLPSGLNYVEVYDDDLCQHVSFTSETNGVGFCYSSSSDVTQNSQDYPVQAFDISCGSKNKISISRCFIAPSSEDFVNIAIPESGPATSCYPITRSVSSNPKTYYLRQTCQSGIWSKTGTSVGSSGTSAAAAASTATNGVVSGSNTNVAGGTENTANTATAPTTSNGTKGISSNSESPSQNNTGLIIGNTRE